MVVQSCAFALVKSSLVRELNIGPYILFLSDAYLYEFTEATAPTLDPFTYPEYQGPPEAPPVNDEEILQVLFPEFLSVLTDPNEKTNSWPLNGVACG